MLAGIWMSAIRLLIVDMPDEQKTRRTFLQKNIRLVVTKEKTSFERVISEHAASRDFDRRSVNGMTPRERKETMRNAPVFFSENYWDGRVLSSGSELRSETARAIRLWSIRAGVDVESASISAYLDDHQDSFFDFPDVRIGRSLLQEGLVLDSDTMMV